MNYRRGYNQKAMVNKTIYFLLLILSISSCQNEAKETYVFLKEAKIAKIDSLAYRYLELGRFSGTILITKGPLILYNNSFGLANYKTDQPFSDDTAFKIGAISELITLDIIQNMVEEGKISLSDKISKYIPEIKSDFTVGSLLEHKTNLPSIQTVQDQNPELKYSTIEFANLAVRSSETSERSDLGYNILGLLVEKVSRKSFQENIEDYSLALGLENTSFRRKKDSTAVGYLYFNYRGEGPELQQAPSYDPEIAFSSYGLKSTAEDLVKILDNTKEKEISLSGYLENDGFSYSVDKDSESDTIVLVLSNRRHPVGEEISNSIQAILQGESYMLPLPRTPFAIDPTLFEDYVGTYAVNENMQFKVFNERDSLFLQMGPNRIYLVPQSSHQFYMEQNDAEMRFLRDDQDSVTEVMLLDGFLEGNTAKRIEK